MERQTTPSDRLLSPAFVLLLTIDLVMQLGMYFTRPIISSYAVLLGASLTVGSFLGGLNATVAMVTRPASGFLSDAFGKMPLMVGSCLLFAISSFGCAYATSASGLGLFCAIQGVAFAIRTTVMTGMVALVTPKGKTASGIGLMGVSYTAGAAFGPLVGERICTFAGYHTAFVAAGILFFVGLALACLFKLPKTLGESDPQQRTSPPRASNTLKKHKLFYAPAVPLAITAGLIMVAHGSMNALIILLGEMDVLDGATLYFTIYALVAMAAKPLAGTLVDRVGLKPLAIPCMLIAAFGMVLLAIDRSALAVCTAALCMGAGQGSIYSALQAEAIRKAPASESGRAAGTFFIGPDLGMGLGPVASGFVLATWGVEAMFLFACASILLAAAMFILWQRNQANMHY